MGNILKQSNYYITVNSNLKCLLYSYNTPITSIVGPYKAGTLNKLNVPVNGTITINDNVINNKLELEYIPKENFLGEDSFEFLVKYQDGETITYEIKIIVKDKLVNVYTEDFFTDVYLDNTDQILYEMDLESIYKSSLDVPTEINFSILSKDLNTVLKTSTINIVNNFSSLIESTSNTIFDAYSIGENILNESNNTNIVCFDDINLKVKKIKEFNGNCNIVIKFKNFINKVNGVNIDLEERHFINFKLRPIDMDYSEGDIEIVVPDFEGFPTPEFVSTNLNYPNPPLQPNYIKDNKYEKLEGELFENTYAHREYDSRLQSTIKVGKRVPDNAVNLAYYYNVTSGLENTMSAIETNMNNVEMHYIDQWVHKRNLGSKDDNLFSQYIEFSGEENTELEGYYGMLYRDYIMWEEQTIKDLEPSLKAVYQEYKGQALKEFKRVPKLWEYDDGIKSGNLKLVHSISEAIEFKRNSNNLLMPSRFVTYAKYEGLVTKKYTVYHGSAKYSGIITKKDGMANIDPEQPKEVIMFPDDYGVLHKQNGDILLDDDLFYITDEFIDDTPLYYKHKLKYRIYDSIGPNKYGISSSVNVKLILENGYLIDENKYKWKLITVETLWKNIYDAYIYTSFIPSIEIPVYITYDAMPIDSYINIDNINPTDCLLGQTEKLSVYPAIHKDDFTVDKKYSITKQSQIKINKVDVVLDEREPIYIEYSIMADDMESAIFRTHIMNYKYATSEEKNKFINKEMIVSEKVGDIYLTAREMFEKSSTQENIEKINDKTIFRIKYNILDVVTFENKEKVIMYTEPKGSSLIMARTYIDTGFPGDKQDETGIPLMNKNLPEGRIYKKDGDKIYKGYSVLCRNVSKITINTPIIKDPLKSWTPSINYAYFSKEYERIDKTIQIIYSVPEFYAQIYGKYGPPYIDVVSEVVKHLGNNKIKTSRCPLYIDVSDDWTPKNISIYKVNSNGSKRKLNIKDYNFQHGIIELEENISDNDLIQIDYTYEEKYYHYSGYYENNDMKTKMIDIDLNPSMYSTYMDNSTEIYTRQNTYNLFNRIVHFFLRPMRMIDKSNGEILEENKMAIYHRVDTPEAISPFDLHIGRIFIRHHSSLKSTKLIDTRSRGGGILESIKDNIRRELEPESDFYLDIGTLDGKPYHENSVVVIKINEAILEKNGGRFSEDDVKNAIDKWCACGMFPIIEYIPILNEELLPQNTLNVYKQIDNLSSYKPKIQALVVTV